MESADASGPASLLLPATSPLLAPSYGPNSGSFNKKAPPPTANPQSHGSLACTPVSLRPKGHYRSSSLENNPFHLTAGGAKPQMIGLSIAQTSFTGTLKSRREQKRISDLLSKQSSTGLLHGSSGACSLTLTSGGGRDAASSQSESSLRKAHFENIREIFEKNNSKNAAAQQCGPSKVKPATSASAVMASVAGEPTGSGGGHSSSLGLPGIDDKPPKIQACSGILGKGKQVIRPIAFKPVPYKCNTPNYGGAAIGGRLTELSDRYGSTPSLGPSMSMQYKFGSTTDLHHLQQHHHHHHHQQQQQQLQQQFHYQHSHQQGSVVGSGGSNGSTPVAVLPPTSMSNSYHPHYTHHHQYGTLTRKGSSIPFKTYDSLESILKLPDSMVASYPSASHGLFHRQDSILDMAPSPSDSGISELEAALRDRDSELAYLRQTMEHNEQVIFKVHQDKEKHWEQELNRLKAIHEGRLRAGAQKVHKLEQLLMMQTFQLRQDKRRLQEDNARLQTDIAVVKDQNEQHKCELGQAKLSAKDLKEQNGDLLDEIQMLRRVVSDLKERLEESEWNLCQKNGEIALMKTQLKEAQSEMAAKDQDIVQLKSDLKLQNYDDISLKKSEIKKELDFDLEISQLNRIVIFKDQIIVLMNNEIQKLRKELSDISILRGYEGAPTGRYTRYRKKLELVAQRFQETAANDNNNNNNSSTSNKPIDPPAEADCSESIIRNYFNSKLEMNKKLFLSAPICNYSDEDKSTIIDAYGGGRKPAEMVDITLDLNSLLPNNVNARLPAESADEDTVNATHDTYHHQSSSDDDYKSMTPTQEEQEENEQRKPAPVSGKKGTATTGDANALTADAAAERLNRELVCCRESFEQERMKWADEKEKVLVYQRQLQKNYVEMCKRTQELEQQLKALQVKPKQLEATTADTDN